MQISWNALNMYEIENFHKELLAQITTLEGAEFLLDFANVEQIDLANVQLLFSLKKMCQNQHIKLIFINIHSKQIKNLFLTFALYDIFEVRS
jgi:anti-anti-sigma regulatory factor